MQYTRLLYAIAIAAAIQCVAGCAAWQTRSWDLSQLRDPRAADLDHRLTQRPEPLGNAFSDAAGSSVKDEGADDE